MEDEQAAFRANRQDKDNTHIARNIMKRQFRRNK